MDRPTVAPPRPPTPRPEKRDLLERALRIKERHYGPDHFQVTSTLASLGNAHGDLGDATKKRDFLERALRIKERHYGPDHFGVIEDAKTWICWDLGRTYLEDLDLLGRWEDLP